MSKADEQIEKRCPFNPENQCSLCKLQINGVLDEQCVFIYIQYRVQGLDQFRGVQR